MNKNQFTIFAVSLMLALTLISFASAQLQTLGTFKQGEKINLVQNCLTSTYSNISRIMYPNGTFALNTQKSMVKNGDDYSYEFDNTKASGNYIVYGSCDESGSKTTWVYDFEVTATGNTLTSAKATSYVIIYVISLLIFVGLLLIGIYLPINNKKDEMTGYIIAINNLKYLKLLCLGIAYMVSVFIGYLSWMISYAYLDMEFVTNMFRFIFIAQVALILPIFAVTIYLLIANAVRDSKVGEMLTRGFKVR